jgi:indolepyruvate ferredoxin oxidoreductase
MDMVLDRSAVTLASRFVDRDRPVLLTGIQALLRLLLEQQRLDQEAGLHTAIVGLRSAGWTGSFGPRRS